jgi:hypothetical protein
LIHSIEPIREISMLGDVIRQQPIHPDALAIRPGMETASGFIAERAAVELLQDRFSEETSED